MTEWQAFYEREPWGSKRNEDHAWFFFSEMMALICNVNRDPKKRSRPYEGKDFRPEEPEDDVDEELELQARQDRMRQFAEMMRARFMGLTQPEPAIVLTDPT